MTFETAFLNTLLTQEHDQTAHLGDIWLSKRPGQIFRFDRIGSSIALIVYDHEHLVGGVAHIVLPESRFDDVHTAMPSNEAPKELHGKFADLAVPILMAGYTEILHGQKASTSIYMVGGSQLFNLAGGAGNILNVGARNAIAIRAALTKLGFIIKKADVGGNKGRSIEFRLADGQITIQPLGSQSFQL